MKDAKGITSAEIRQALRTFQESGGLIRQLPDEIVLPARLVGDRHGMYENPGTSRLARNLS